MKKSADHPPPGPPVELRLLWTLAVVALAIAGGYVVLPGIDADALAFLMRSSPGRFDASSLSVLALGLVPFITAAFLVEVLALLVPRWRPLRYGGAVTRQKLRRATLAVTLIVALVQGYFLVVWLRNTSYASGPTLWLVEPGLLQQAILMVTLAAGVFALLALAGSIERLGIGSGISVLIAGTQLWSWAGRLRHGGLSASGELPPVVSLLLAALVIAAVAVTTALVVRRRVPGSLSRLPVCGLVPLPLLASLTTLPATLAMINVAAPPLLAAPPAWLTVAALLALTVALSAVLPREEQRPAVKSWAPGEKWSGAVWSAAYLLALWGAQRLLGVLVGGTVIEVLAVAVITTVALDLAAEASLRAASGPLACVWQSHSVAAADAAVAALRTAGVPAVARGLYHRSLWRFFGPHLDVDVLVPVAAADAARPLLGESAATLFAAPAASAPAPVSPPLSPSARSRLALTLALLLAWIAAGLGWRYAPTGQLVLAVELAPSLSAPEREAALTQDAAIVSARLAGLRLWPVWVSVSTTTDQLTVRFPRRDAPEPAVLVAALTRNTQLQFRLAEVGGDYLERLAVWADTHAAEHPGVRSGLDHLHRVHDGGTLRDPYLEGPSREVLQRVLRELPAELSPPPERELVLEPLRRDFAEDFAPAGPRPAYRTHLLHRTPLLTGQDVADAQLTVQPDTREPSIQLTFTAEGATRFGDFTAAHIGDRLAIVVNGEVSSAPIIHSTIRGGRAMITLGRVPRGDEAARHEEAQILTAGLRGGSLAAPLRVVSLH